MPDNARFQPIMQHNYRKKALGTREKFIIYHNIGSKWNLISFFEKIELLLRLIVNYLQLIKALIFRGFFLDGKVGNLVYLSLVIRVPFSVCILYKQNK